MDFTPFFERYEALLGKVDQAFGQVKKACPGEVRCEKGCSDCCYALFDLTLIEALYLNARFNQAFAGAERSAILERADRADREIHKLKRQAFKDSQAGRPAAEILADMAKARVRCPFLGDDDLCVLYDRRPITCRVYGAPTAIEGRGHSCGKSGFAPGGSYPTVHLDKIQEALFALSRELVAGLNTKFPEMHEMLVPLSMALLTTYDKEYLGLRDEEAAPAPEPKPEPKGPACAACSEDSSACASCGGAYEVVLGKAPDSGKGK